MLTGNLKNILNAWSTQNNWQILNAQLTVYDSRKYYNTKFNLIEVNILHPNILHHGRLLIDVWSDDTES